MLISFIDYCHLIAYLTSKKYISALRRRKPECH